MKYFDAFSGYGGFSLGIQKAYVEVSTRSKVGGIKEDTEGDDEKRERLESIQGEADSVSGRQYIPNSTNVENERPPHCVGYSEIDKYAIQIYEKHFPDHKNYGDITKLDPNTLPDFDLFVGGFPFRLFLSLASGKALLTPEEHSSLTSQGFLKLKIPKIYCWKMLKDCYLMTMETLSKPSSPRLQNWGMTSNGKCLTARISESPRIGKECSLSDILEDSVDDKYFLSEQATNSILNLMDKGTKLHTASKREEISIEEVM